MSEKKLLLAVISYVVLTLGGAIGYEYERRSYEERVQAMEELALTQEVARSRLNGPSHRFLQALVDGHHKEHREPLVLEEIKLYPLRIVQVHNEGEMLSLELTGSVLEGLKCLSAIVEKYPLWEVQIKKVWTKDTQVHMIWNFP